MAKYRTTEASYGQGLFLNVNLKKQLLPGTFEHMLNELIGREIDISFLDQKYKNDLTGASAIPPAVLLKLIIYAYKKGCFSSRRISDLNENNMVAKALTCDMQIHWTTIADFISGNSEAFKKIFVKVLAYCNELGLIGGEKRYELDDFKYDETEDTYECPNGKRLCRKKDTVQNGVLGKVYQASLTDCKVCPFFSKCSWSKKEQSRLNQGKALRITEKYGHDSLCRKQREKQATEEFQVLYAKRIQIIEPVFANIRYCKGLDRFTLRGKKKVNGQWQLYCMVHNLGKCLNELNIRRKSA